MDPGTIILTGSVERTVACPGSWLAHHDHVIEYVVEDVKEWGFLAHSGRIAGASSLATHGALDRSERHLSHAGHGYGDELRVASFAAQAPFTDHGPGVVVFDPDGVPESVSPAAERWIRDLDEHPTRRRRAGPHGGGHPSRLPAQVGR